MYSFYINMHVKSAFYSYTELFNTYLNNCYLNYKIQYTDTKNIIILRKKS